MQSLPIALSFLNVDKTLKTAQISTSIVVLLVKSCICIDNGRIFNFTYSESFVMMIIFCFSLNIDGSKQSEKADCKARLPSFVIGRRVCIYFVATRNSPADWLSVLSITQRIYPELSVSAASYT